MNISQAAEFLKGLQSQSIIHVEGVIVLKDEEGKDACWLEDPESQVKLIVKNAKAISDFIDQQPVPKLAGGSIWFKANCELSVCVISIGIVAVINGIITPPRSTTIRISLDS